MTSESYERLLTIGANWSAILTAIIAAGAYGRYLWERRQKRLRLEDHLQNEKARGRDKGQRSVTSLVARLGMSETDLFDAAFRSKRVRRVVTTDDEGFATKVLFEYVGD